MSPPIDEEATKDQRFACLLLLGFCFAGSTTAALTWYKRNQVDEPKAEFGVISLDREKYDYGQNVVVEFINEKPNLKDFLGIWPLDHQQDRVPSAFYQYACGSSNCRDIVYGGEITFGANQDPQILSDRNLTWPLCNGDWKVCLLQGETNTTLICSDPFSVQGGGCTGLEGPGAN